MDPRNEIISLTIHRRGTGWGCDRGKVPDECDHRRTACQRAV